MIWQCDTPVIIGDTKPSIILCNSILFITYSSFIFSIPSWQVNMIYGWCIVDLQQVRFAKSYILLHSFGLVLNFMPLDYRSQGLKYDGVNVVSYYICCIRHLKQLFNLGNVFLNWFQFITCKSSFLALDIT